MRANDFIFEAKVPIVRDQILADVRKHGGNPDEYFVRFTSADKLGFSNKQLFSKAPDVDHPEFSVDRIGPSLGRRVLWFYPLKYYLKSDESTYGSELPYVWLVKLKPNAWLQTVKRGDTKVQQPPEGKQRVGILRMSNPPAALFFTHGFDLISKYYDYASQHRRHGQVKGPEASNPTFFQKIRDRVL